MVGSREVRVLDAGEECPALPLVEGEGVARAVIWPGIGAQLRSMHRISLAPGARTIPQRHPMEAVYYVLSGGGTVRDPEHPPRGRWSKGPWCTSSPAPPMCSKPVRRASRSWAAPAPRTLRSTAGSVDVTAGRVLI